MGLGSLELVTLAEARDKALLCRKLLLDGIDPLEERRQADAGDAAPPRRSPSATARPLHRGARQGLEKRQAPPAVAQHLETYAYPVIGDLPVAAIDTGLVMQIIEPIWPTKTETASRLRGRIESILDWATARGYRTGETRPAGAATSTSCCRQALEGGPGRAPRGAALCRDAGVHGEAARQAGIAASAWSSRS